MRYKVPQNIDMEDRIVGPLTMVQFVTVMVGGMLAYVSYLLFTPTTFWFAAIPIGLATIAFAFLKVNDQPFPKFAAAALLFLVRPKNRIWQKSDNAETLKIVHKPNTATARLGAQSTVQRSQLEELSTVLDTGGTAPIPTTPQPSLTPPTPVPVLSKAATAPVVPEPAAPPTPLENGELVAVNRLQALRASTGQAAEDLPTTTQGAPSLTAPGSTPEAGGVHTSWEGN